MDLLLMKSISVKSFVSLFIILSLILTSGCFESFSNFDFDDVVRRANPYLNKIEVDNQSLQDYAFSIIQECQTQEPACILNQIYRHIVENFQYISDPEGEELIRSPYDTIKKKGGDCEDLSILLISLLENIGITSFLVLTDTHAYALAVGINPNTLWPYVEESLLQQVEKDNNKTIRQYFSDTIEVGSGWYYGGDGSNLSASFESLTLTYTISSSRPIDFFVFPSYEDFNQSYNQNSFEYYQSCRYENQEYISDSCTINQYGGIGILNNHFRPVMVTLELEQYFKPSFYSLFQNETISSYTINGKQSVVLDPTAGDYGYPGYDANVTGEKIAFDPITKEYVYLD
jgi:hypothetical protein